MKRWYIPPLGRYDAPARSRSAQSLGFFHRLRHKRFKFSYLRFRRDAVCFRLLPRFLGSAKGRGHARPYLIITFAAYGRVPARKIVLVFLPRPWRTRKTASCPLLS